MVEITDLIRGHSVKNALDALYFTARFIKQADEIGKDGKDFFEDDERSAPSKEARALTMDLIAAIEASVGMPAAVFDASTTKGILRGLASAGDALDFELTPEEKAGAEKAIQAMLSPSVRVAERHTAVAEHSFVKATDEIRLEYNHPEIVGQSPAILKVLKDAEMVARTDSAVLIRGETGTGKELIARAIHRRSKRKNRAMVTVNCAALPASLIDSELFGRERGAYTGAVTREVGRFELADRSTILLDEIGELPLELQSKLLRLLQEGEFERLGSSKTIHVDVRVLATTSRDLEKEVREGKFREDLYYRLNVFPIRVPPLRERQEDIPLITWYYLRLLGKRMGRDIELVPEITMTAMQQYQWPGNVRELRNVIERSLVTNSGPEFVTELPQAFDVSQVSETAIEKIERKHIILLLERSGWRVTDAAEALGLKSITLGANQEVEKSA